MLQGTFITGSNATSIVAVVNTPVTDSMIYGCSDQGNLTYLLGSSDGSGMMAHALGDYFAALNFGLIASTSTIAGYGTTAIGDQPSWVWYGNSPVGPDYLDSAAVPYADMFGKLQSSGTLCYNQYAAYLAGVGEAYGFPYTDRLTAPVLNFTPGTTLTITVLADSFPDC